MFLPFLTDIAVTLFTFGLVLHLVCDWLLQNAWMSDNKSNLLHPAAWVHSGIHLVGLLLIFPWWAALAIAGVHLLIDTRVPLLWWSRIFRQTQEGAVVITLKFWCDQTAHILVLALAALIVGR